MVKQIKVTLDDELESMFEQIKEQEALTVDAEVFRQMLIKRFRELFPEKEQEVVPAE